VATEMCPKCGAEGQPRPVGWQMRILLALSTGVVVLIPGVALTMIGAGLPLLLAAPLATLFLLFVPLRRCERCGHMAIWRAG
jgi:hypothetical protein